MYGIDWMAVLGMFVIGILIGILVIGRQLPKGIKRKKKYSFSEPAPLNLKEMNPGEGSAAHSKKPEAVDGASAIKDFKHH